MAEAEKLEPPKGAPVADPGAHDLAESSDSEDQFTDAQSAPISPKISPSIPTTRVEKIDDEPAYGEVPGTEAYAKREQDAIPDEIAIVQDDVSSDASISTIDATVPATLVEEAPGNIPTSHSPEYEERRKADTSPDLVLDSDGNIKEIKGESITDDPPSPPGSPVEKSEEGNATPQAALAPPVKHGDNAENHDDEDDDGDDDFGDDFDDFEEGNEDDDFDDFDDGFQQPETTPTSVPAPSPLPSQPQTQLPFPIPDFDGLDSESVISCLEPYLADLFPPEQLDLPTFPPLSKESSIFLTPRSASLWSQLVAPPPLAPPDWIRSRIRRLFLVSLGVPVDLDEILPASKQKKLVLPSLHDNTSSTSVDTQGRPSSSSRKRKGPPPQPELDLVAARYLCMTTDEALNGMTNGELKAHVGRLEAMESVAKEALEYWKKRTDEKIGDREAFEGVIENLVKHARKVRK
ncbi:hypothetical protein B0J13DRAFT_536854 [Dactylonectria estremocensis]|uniref:Uncharacterized protein n=1 Tax=Dactylonectria estremocensis TaxID=1079267 RepID=A0A9P9FI84_9HYPO|nr:hypothetical protein B0J13DRAFT_536854 [Dactylonectria estremocensis]